MVDNVLQNTIKSAISDALEEQKKRFVDMVADAVLGTSTNIALWGGAGLILCRLFGFKGATKWFWLIEFLNIFIHVWLG